MYLPNNVKILLLIVLAGIMSVAAGLYYMQAGDDEIVTVEFDGSFTAPQPTGMNRVKLTLNNEITISHVSRNGTEWFIECENSVGVVSLVAQLSGNDPHQNGPWMTSRGDFRGNGSIDPAERLFSSPMWTQTPNLATVTQCVGLGYYK